MGIKIDWDDAEETRLLCRLEGAWTWDEMYETLRRVKETTDAADHVIAAIVDLSNGVSIPGGALFSKSTLEHAKNMLKFGEGGTGPVVIVGASPLIKMAYNTLYAMDPKTLGGVQFAGSVEEARTLLNTAA